MKVDIWSDIRCPFCYIGKKKFEKALSQFPHKEEVEVVWHSFELEPSLVTDTSVNVYDYLAERKGQSLDWSIKMHEHVTQVAKEAGLEFNFEKTVMANSFNAHRLIQLAKTKKLGDAAEETLFKAYFIAGRNIDDNNTLIEAGTEIGLDKQEIIDMLASDAYANEVREDEAAANNIRISGVPFFILNNKYGVSGAQDPEVFSKALQQAWTEYEKLNPVMIMSNANGETCDVNGVCAPSNDN
jgi:predicted DsbA family dithiol-disulfide isomerase